MFTPTHEDVCRFFCGAWAKSRAGQPMQAMEILAAGWIAEHPQWHGDLADADAAVARVYPEGNPGGNPLLHLAMHLSISEQCGMDQPRGIRQAVKLLAHHQGNLHAAHHTVMEYLGQMIAQAQARNQPPDGAAYVAAVQRRATSGRLFKPNTGHLSA